MATKHSLLSNKTNAIIEEFEKVGFTNYYLQMFDKEKPLKNRAELLLKFIDVDPSKLGYAYLKEALEYVLENGENKTVIPASKIYNFIADKRKTTYQAIERNIRTVKEECWCNMENIELKKIIFGNTYAHKIPGNMVFLYKLYHFLLIGLEL